MYLRKMRPRTTCLYSAASSVPRSLSAAAQRVASKLRSVVGFVIGLAIPVVLSVPFLGGRIVWDTRGRRNPLYNRHNRTDSGSTNGRVRPSGCGKSHLIAALLARVVEQTPDPAATSCRPILDGQSRHPTEIA